MVEGIVETGAAPVVTPAPVETPAPATTQTTEVDVKSAVPEKYDLKPPEGFAVSNPEALEKFQALARGMGWTNEQAQEFLTHQATYRQQLLTEQKAAQEAELNRLNTEYISKIKADPELGGVNFERTAQRVSTFAKALDKSGEFVKFITEDPHGRYVANHPVFVKAFERLGHLFEDDTMEANTGSGGMDSLAHRMNFFKKST